MKFRAAAVWPCCLGLIASGYSMTLAEAINAPGRALVTGGVGRVSVSTDWSFDGAASAEFLPSNGWLWMDTYVQGPCTAQFRVYVIEGSRYEFYIDGELKAYKDDFKPDLPWALGTHITGPGLHYFRWQFMSYYSYYEPPVRSYLDVFDTAAFVPQFATNHITITNYYIVGAFNGGVMVDKPAENSTLRLRKGRGITLKGTSMSLDGTQITAIQVSADGAKTWQVTLPDKKGKWKIRGIAENASGVVPIYVRAMNSSNNVSQSSVRTLTIERR